MRIQYLVQLSPAAMTAVIHLIIVLHILAAYEALKETETILEELTAKPVANVVK